MNSPTVLGCKIYSEPIESISMKYIDKVDAAILAFVLTVLAVLFLMIAYSAGASTEQHRYRKEAVERNFAYYAVNSSGKTEFRWKIPARSQDSVDESLVYRIGL